VSYLIYFGTEIVPHPEDNLSMRDRIAGFLKLPNCPLLGGFTVCGQRVRVEVAR